MAPLLFLHEIGPVQVTDLIIAGDQCATFANTVTAKM